MKRLIGVMPLWDDEKESLWMLPGYLEGIRQAGGLPLMFPLDLEEKEIFQLSDLCQGFLFTGGHDVSPDLYGEESAAGTISCQRRDRLEKLVLDYALERDKPVLGICRGIQFINAALGGSLYQDLPAQHPSSVDHHMSPPYDRICHQVKIVRDSPLYALLGQETLGVNSYHHQAVKRVAPGLSVMAVSEDGIVEALYMARKNFLWAVQWHPEFSYQSDWSSRRIFSAFVAHC